MLQIPAIPDARDSRCPAMPEIPAIPGFLIIILRGSSLRFSPLKAAGFIRLRRARPGLRIMLNILQHSSTPPPLSLAARRAPCDYIAKHDLMMTALLSRDDAHTDDAARIGCRAVLQQHL